MRILLLSVIWYAARKIHASTIPRSYDLCLGFSALSNGKEAMAGEGYSIVAALEVCENIIEGCVAVSFDKVVLGQPDQGRCRFYRNLIDSDHFVPALGNQKGTFPVIMNVRSNQSIAEKEIVYPPMKLPPSCVVCTGVECFPPSCHAGFAGQPTGVCNPCSRGSWTSEGNVLNTCTPCSGRSCDPKTGESTSAHSKVARSVKILIRRAADIYQLDYSWLARRRYDDL